MDLRNRFNALGSTEELLLALFLSCKNSLTAHIQRKTLKAFAYPEVKIGKTEEKGLYLPQLSTATSSHLLWIHETGLCTEASQCHQATLQMWEQWGTKSSAVRMKPFSPLAWPAFIQVAHSACSPFLRTASCQQPRSNPHHPALSTPALWHLASNRWWSTSAAEWSPPTEFPVWHNSPGKSTPQAACLDVNNNTKILSSSLVKLSAF